MKLLENIVRSIWGSESRSAMAIAMGLEALEGRALFSGMLVDGSVEPAGVADGMSNTLMMGEAYVRPSIWDGKTQQARQVTVVQDF